MATYHFRYGWREGRQILGKNTISFHHIPSDERALEKVHDRLNKFNEVTRSGVKYFAISLIKEERIRTRVKI